MGCHCSRLNDGSDDVMLLNEVTSVLNPELVKKTLNTTKKLAAGGVTMTIVTHKMGFAQEVSDRIIFIEECLIAEESPPKKIFFYP